MFQEPLLLEKDLELPHGDGGDSVSLGWCQSTLHLSSGFSIIFFTSSSFWVVHIEVLGSSFVHSSRQFVSKVGYELSCFSVSEKSESSLATS